MPKHPLTEGEPRKVHPRGRNSPFDVHTYDYSQMTQHLMYSANMHDLVMFLRKYRDHVTDEHIMCAFHRSAEHNMVRNDMFWDEMVPLVKDQLRTLDRQGVHSIHLAIAGAGLWQLQDNEFWEIIEQKLVDQGLLRYFNLDQQADIVKALGNVNRGSDLLLENIERQFILHRRALTESQIEIAKEGFAKMNKGSEIL
jgi:hypothetical protein